jgi:uncharacterized protein (TIGR00369 family)
MNSDTNVLKTLQAINQSAAFNAWAGITISKADSSEVELQLPWRQELGQYSGFLHAGVVGAMLDTACGFAAAANTGKRVLASHYSVSMVAPAIGEMFIARGKVVKAGKRQIFTTAELYSVNDGQTKLVAIGETILMPADE